MGSRVERIRLDRKKLPAFAAETIAAALVAAVAARGSATLCLSGGTTPRFCYELLARLPGVPWPNIGIYFGDERCVPPDHADSNYRMAREALLEPAGIPAHSVHRLRGEAHDRDAAAAEYESLLPNAFDVLVLGIGEDGHTASLFPRSPALRETLRRVVHVVGDKPPPDRLTLTAPPIRSAHLALVLAAGRSKAAAVQRALEGELDIDACPAQIARDAVWLMDTEAGSGLAGTWGSALPAPRLTPR
jgi:6-phosphogluconolactonase